MFSLTQHIKELPCYLPLYSPFPTSSPSIINTSKNTTLQLYHLDLQLPTFSDQHKQLKENIPLRLMEKYQANYHFINDIYGAF